MFTALVVIRDGENKNEFQMTFKEDDLLTALDAVEAVLKFAIGESISVSILRK